MKKNSFQYFKNYKFNSLLFKNFIIILLPLFSCALVLSLNIYFGYKKDRMHEIEQQTEYSLIRLRDAIDNAYDEIKNKGRILTNDEEIHRIVKYTGKWNANYELTSDILDLCQYITFLKNESIQSIYVSSCYHDSVLTNTGMTRLEYMKDTSWSFMVNKEIENVLIVNRTMREENNQTVQGISFIFEIPYKKRNIKEGNLVINMSTSWIKRMIENNTKDFKKFFILNGQGKVIYKFDPSSQSFDDYHIASNEFTRTDQNVRWCHNDEFDCYLTSLRSDWIYVYKSDLSKYYNALNKYKRTITFLFFAMFLFSIYIAYVISTRLFIPIRSIIQFIDNPHDYYEKNMNRFRKQNEKNEIKYVISTIMNNLTKQELYKKELEEYIIKYHETQISLLQSQMNPHFLCNTLQTISFCSMNLLHGENSVSEMIDDLSIMLQDIMNIKENLISLESEIQYTMAYINILEKRYTNKLSVEWNYPIDILQFHTLKFILQPLVENSIKHGYKNMKVPGKILITIVQCENSLCFLVTDYGTGADTNWINQANDKLSHMESENDHIGISNINQRIRLLFGDKYGVQIEHSSIGFKIKVSIPCMK